MQRVLTQSLVATLNRSKQELESAGTFRDQVSLFDSITLTSKTYLWQPRALIGDTWIGGYWLDPRN